MNTEQNSDKSEKALRIVSVVSSAFGYCSNCDAEVEIDYTTESCCMICQQDYAACDSEDCRFYSQEISRCSNCEMLM